MEEDKQKCGRGRPKKDKSLGDCCRVRLNDNDKSMLDHLIIEKDISKSEIIRKALRFYYNFETKRR